MPIPVHFSSLIPTMLMFILAIYCDHFQFTLIHGPNILGPYAILFFTASDFTFITSHVHNWGLFFALAPSLHSFWSISLLLSSSIILYSSPTDLGSSFFSVLSLPFHGVLKARILKWFAIPFSSGPRFVRTLHYDPSVLGGPTWHGS